MSKGTNPFALLLENTGQSFPRAAAFHVRILGLQRSIEQHRTAIRAKVTGQYRRFPATLTLSRVRSSAQYQGRPAAADMAFCIAAWSQGWSEAELSAALERHYLSRDPSPTRYIRRTIDKALRWTACPI